MARFQEMRNYAAEGVTDEAFHRMGEFAVNTVQRERDRQAQLERARLQAATTAGGQTSSGLEAVGVMDRFIDESGRNLMSVDPLGERYYGSPLGYQAQQSPQYQRSVAYNQAVPLGGLLDRSPRPFTQEQQAGANQAVPLFQERAMLEALQPGAQPVSGATPAQLQQARVNAAQQFPGIPVEEVVQTLEDRIMRRLQFK